MKSLTSERSSNRACATNLPLSLRGVKRTARRVVPHHRRAARGAIRGVGREAAAGGKKEGEDSFEESSS